VPRVQLQPHPPVIFFAILCTFQVRRQCTEEKIMILQVVALPPAQNYVGCYVGDNAPSIVIAVSSERR
jgi:hypothetical protein